MNKRVKATELEEVPMSKGARTTKLGLRH